MGMLSVCKVIASIGELKKDGTTGAAANVAYYFRGSNVYNGDAAFSTATGIEVIPDDKWDGSHPLIPVGELIGASILNRVSVSVKDSSNKKRRYDLIVAEAKMSKIIGGTAAEKLDGKPYKLTKRDGSVLDRGTIIRVGGKTEAYNP
jgi:hypothetical protein